MHRTSGLLVSVTPSNNDLDMYRSGQYFSDPSRHAQDGVFKAAECWKLLSSVADPVSSPIHSYADVGCGSGVATKELAKHVRAGGHPLADVVGFDVSPHVASVAGSDDQGIRFVQADFAQGVDRFDLVTLFDVFEHVADPTEFLRSFRDRTTWLGLHIPLEDCSYYRLTDVYMDRIRNPGHVTILRVESALNLLAASGWLVRSYAYTPGFRLAEEPTSWKDRAVQIMRSGLWRLNPALLSRTLGGVSLVVVAQPLT